MEVASGGGGERGRCWSKCNREEPLFSCKLITKGTLPHVRGGTSGEEPSFQAEGAASAKALSPVGPSMPPNPTRWLKIQCGDRHGSHAPLGMGPQGLCPPSKRWRETRNPQGRAFRPGLPWGHPVSRRNGSLDPHPHPGDARIRRPSRCNRQDFERS